MTMTRVTVLALSCLAASASADVTITRDEGLFLSRISGTPVSEGFESYAVDLVDGPRAVSFDYFDMSFDGGSTFGVSNEVDLSNGVQPHSGSHHIRANFGGGSAAVLTVGFGAGTTAFGTFISDVEILALAYTINLSDGQALTGTAAGLTGNGGSVYFGVESDGAFIESIDFRYGNLSGLDGIFFDDATVVPVPSAGAVLIAGLGLTARRRR